MASDMQYCIALWLFDRLRIDNAIMFTKMQIFIMLTTLLFCEIAISCDASLSFTCPSNNAAYGYLQALFNFPWEVEEFPGVLSIKK